MIAPRLRPQVGFSPTEARFVLLGRVNRLRCEGGDANSSRHWSTFYNYESIKNTRCLSRRHLPHHCRTSHLASFLAASSLVAMSRSIFGACVAACMVACVLAASDSPIVNDRPIVGILSLPNSFPMYESKGRSYFAVRADACMPPRAPNRVHTQACGACGRTRGRTWTGWRPVALVWCPTRR